MTPCPSDYEPVAHKLFLFFISFLGYRTDSGKPSGRLPNGIPQVPIARSCSDLDAYRTTLPIYDMKDHVVKTVWDNSVVLISGDTGTGKTTQVLYTN